MGFIGVEVEQETSAPPLKKNPGSALTLLLMVKREFSNENPAENVEKKERTLQQQDDNVVRMSWNVQLFCVIFVLEFGGFLVKKVVSFSFTLDWFLFLHFFFSTGKKNI